MENPESHAPKLVAIAKNVSDAKMRTKALVLVERRSFLPRNLFPDPRSRPCTGIFSERAHCRLQNGPIQARVASASHGQCDVPETVSD